MKKHTIHNWDELPAVITPELAGIVLNCSREHIYRMCKDGTLPAKKISPRKWIIPKDKFIEFIES